MSSFEPLAFEDMAVAAPRASRAWAPASLDAAPVTSAPSYSLVDEAAEAAARARAEAEAEAALVAQQHQLELEAAWQDGHAAGREEGERAERARLRHAMQAAERALEDLRAGEEHWTGNIEENLAALAVAIARQVVGQHAAIDDAIVRGVVQKALQEFPIDQPLVIRVHPADLEALQGAEREGTGLPVEGRAEVRWLGDARVQHGGCLVEGRERIVDGRVDTALERTYRRLTYTNA
jgi:flagellar biosynthesis/type III secretory pathway protein FliH